MHRDVFVSLLVVSLLAYPLIPPTPPENLLHSPPCRQQQPCGEILFYVNYTSTNLRLKIRKGRAYGARAENSL